MLKGVLSHTMRDEAASWMGHPAKYNYMTLSSRSAATSELCRGALNDLLSHP
jgi:Splicing factor 3B subunit 10 (SF3b10)